MDQPIQLPIDGVLDLHTFQPREVKDLVLDYLAACRQRGIFQVRIIHGKGTGQLRRTVHAILAKHPDVASFTLDHPEYGGWGATLISLLAQEGLPENTMPRAVSLPNAPLAYSPPLEDAAVPDATRIAATVRAMLEE